MARYRVRITDLPRRSGTVAGGPRFVAVRQSADGVTLVSAAVEDFPTVFNSQLALSGKQVTVIQDIQQDPAEPGFVICEVLNLWVPFDEKGKLDIAAVAQGDTVKLRRAAKGKSSS